MHEAWILQKGKGGDMRFEVYTFEFVTHEILFDVQMTYEFF